MIARTLSRRIELVTADTDVSRSLRYLECDPEIAVPPTENLTIFVESHRAYYRIVQNDKVLREQMTAKAVTDTLHAHLFILSLADYPTAPLIHAACLRRGKSRVLLVGPKAGGKTTLALRLIQEGYEVEGDEHVFVTPEGIVARPRGLRVKQSAASLLPDLAEALAAAPYYEDTLGQRIYNVDPRSVGARSWRIEQGHVDVVVLLRPNHGGYSSIRPVSSLMLMQDVMIECGLAATDRSQAVGLLTRFIGAAKGFDLSLGDLGGAVICLNKVVEEFDG